MPTTSFSRRVVAASAACGLLLVGACGSDDSDETTSGVTDQTTATTGPAETTPEPEQAPVEEADDPTKAIAAAGLVTIDDLPEGWTETGDAQPFATEGVSTDDCLIPPGSPIAELPIGAAAASPVFAPTDVAFFLTTWSAVFPDEDAAAAWAATTATTEYEECIASYLEANVTSSGNELEVQILTTPEDQEWAAAGGAVRFSTHGLFTDGEITTAIYTFTYQVGAALQHVLIEVGYIEDQGVEDQAWAAAEAARVLAADRLVEAQQL